jgi:two-component system cell cycle sensor histidine kinase/response regulator CckA
MATILLVEDDEGVGNIAALTLKQKGYDILPASNGLEALMVYSSYRLKIDLILTDVDMPQMNGLELAARIRARDPSKKILLMSGRAVEDSGNPEDYPMLSKPFLPSQLVAAVDSALEA